MAMGKRKSEQSPLWVPTTALPVSPGHPFYAKLNVILEAAEFDRSGRTVPADSSRSRRGSASSSTRR